MQPREQKRRDTIETHQLILAEKNRSQKKHKWWSGSCTGAERYKEKIIQKMLRTSLALLFVAATSALPLNGTNVSAPMLWSESLSTDFTLWWYLCCRVWNVLVLPQFVRVPMVIDSVVTYVNADLSLKRTRCCLFPGRQGGGGCDTSDQSFDYLLLVHQWPAAQQSSSWPSGAVLGSLGSKLLKM